MKKVCLWVSLLASVVAACSASNSDNKQSAGADPTGATCPSESVLTYESFGKPFMTEYCVRCHSSSVSGGARDGAPIDHNFDTLEGIRTFAEHIDESAAAGPTHTNVNMPPSDPRPSLDQRQKLGEWLACGAP
jgi:cytochrome c5